jgi:PAS domain S-box-containing protein
MNTIDRIKHLPISRKLTILLLLPCVVVLVLAGAVLLGVQIRTFKSEFTKDMKAVAQIVGRNSTAAIAFNDRIAASEILDSLSSKKYILGASLILPDGTEFARYGDRSAQTLAGAFSPDDSTEAFVFQKNDAHLVQPVLLDGKKVATLKVIGDYRSVYASLLKVVGWVLMVVLVIGTGVAFLLSNWLQRFISDPLMRLTSTARTIAEKSDYSVRATEERTSEFGVLTRTFNQMLTRIQNQDRDLSTSQKKIEALINSIEGIVWEWDPKTKCFTYVSPQCERILGYPSADWLGSPDFWSRHLHPEDAEAAISECQDESSSGKPYSYSYRMIAGNGQTVWIRESGSVLTENGKPVVARGILEDITAQKLGAAEVERLNRSLVESSRLAGMAEVATGVLHNVGNVLNSVSVSATLVSNRLRQSKLPKLRQATAMLDTQEGNLANFLTQDPKGKILPRYIRTASEQLSSEQADLLNEIELLTRNIEHIKEIVAMQQSYAKVSGAFENLNAADLVEDALRMNVTSLERHGIKLERSYAKNLPLVKVDRHKALQILVNLIQNAKYALEKGRQTELKLQIRVETSGERVAIRVQDNGMGIAPENLTKIFQHGFTTKANGHGFGLHSGANAAKEMGGQLTVHSDGLDTGATFALEFSALTQEMDCVQSP